MIARLAALFGINSVRKAHTASPCAITSINSAVNHAISYTNCYYVCHNCSVY